MNQSTERIAEVLGGKVREQFGWVSLETRSYENSVEIRGRCEGLGMLSFSVCEYTSDGSRRLGLRIAVEPEENVFVTCDDWIVPLKDETDTMVALAGTASRMLQRASKYAVRANNVSGGN